MRGEQRSQFGFGDDLIASRVPSDHWLMQLDRLVDWKAFEPVLGSLYSPTGRPSHPPRVMCKMLLLEQGFNLSDAEVEMQAQDAHRLSVLSGAVVGRSGSGRHSAGTVPPASAGRPFGPRSRLGGERG